MNPFKYFFLILFSSLCLSATNKYLHNNTYENLAEDSISIERDYELAKTALNLGLYEKATGIYETLLAESRIFINDMRHLILIPTSFVFP